MKDLLQKAFEAGTNYQHNRTTPYKTDVPDFETWYKQLHKPDVMESLPPNYHFSNENGSEVTVMAVKDDWCMVSEEGKDKPYTLPLEFVFAIYQGGNAP